MPVRPDRWEHGSEFHWGPGTEGLATEPVPWTRGRFAGTGRDVLRAVIALGRVTRGWHRLWVPTYFCQEVVAALNASGIRLAAYRDGPLERHPEVPRFERGDVLLAVNFFGLRAAAPLAIPPGVEVIEDHTHDPTSTWASSSTADFCIASLRKTLPVPDGAVAWSPRGHDLFQEPPASAEHGLAASRKLQGMLLKALYLKGELPTKDAYRELLVSGEAGLGTAGEVCAITDLSNAIARSFPIARWREKRRRNHAVLVDRLRGTRWGGVVLDSVSGSAPFCALLVCDDAARRASLRERLIASRIYPAIHWPLERTMLEVPPDHRDVSRRVLSLHCDARYTPEDMARVADAVLRPPTGTPAASGRRDTL